MGLLEGSSGKNGILTVVFASLFLVSLGVFSHNAFADSVVATVDVGSAPFGIGVNNDTNMIYVSAKDNTVSVIDGATDSVTGTIPVGSYPLGVGVNPNTNKIYVANEHASTVSVIDGTTNNVASTIRVGASPTGVGVNPNTNRIYVVNMFDNNVTVIDGATDSVTSTIPVGFHPTGVGVNPNTNKIYVANFGIGSLPGKTVSVIDGATNSVVSTIQVGVHPGSVGVNPNTNMVYVCNFNDKTVSVIDGATNSVTSTILVGVYPDSVGVNPNTNKIYVTNENNNTVSVIDGATDSVTGTIPVGSYPDSVGVNPNTNMIYVSNYYNNAISVINGSSTSSKLTVNSQNNNGHAITGFFTVLYKNGNQISSGFTPVTFTLNNTQAYTVHVGDFGKFVFDHWSDTGSASTTRDIAITSDYAITAVYKTIPHPPTGLAATAVSPSQINLGWTAPGNNGGSAVTGYMIERSADSGSTWSTVIANTGNTGTTYADTGLQSTSAYTYRVSAINSVGTSPPSNTASATTSGNTIASGIALNNVQSTSGTTSASNQITLSGFSAGTGSSQLLLVGISANSNSPVSVTFNGVQLTQAVGSFYNNDAEFWYLKNSTGTGDVIVTMGGPTQAVVGAYSFSGVNQTAPIATHVAKHNTTPNSPNMSITTKYANDWVLDLPSIYGGEKLGSPTCTQQWNLNVPNAITGASSSVTVPSPATVTCKWTASSSDMWDDVAVEVGSYTSGAGTGNTATAPSSPTGLTATPGSAQVALSWTAPASNGGSPIINYNIYRGTSSGSETLLATEGSVTSYTDNTVTNGQTYFYKVTAVNSAGESPQSNEASATPEAPATVPSAPTGLQANPVPPSQIDLSWTASASNGGPTITGFKIERSTDGITFTAITSNTGSTTTAYSDTGLAANTSYTYRVSAINSVGTSLPSNAASAITQSVTATVPVGSSPYGVAYDHAKGEMFVTNSGSNSVSVINDTTNTVTATVPVGPDPTGVAYDSAKGEIFVANYNSDTVSVINDTTNTIIATVPVGVDPYGVAYDSDKGEIFVGNTASDTVSVINDTTNTVTATVPVTMDPWGEAYDPAKGEIFVVNRGSNTVSIIDDTTNTIIATVPVGSDPWGEAYDPAKGEIFVVNRGSNTVSIIDDTTDTVVATVPVGVNPDAAAYDSAKGEIFVANRGASGCPSGCPSSVSVISDDTNIAATISGASFPYGVAYDSAKGEIFVTNSLSNNVSVISDATNTTPSSITLDNVQSTSGTTDSSNQITLSSFNATAGVDRLLVVGVSANNNNVGSITFAGVPLAREVSHFTNNDAEFWYLANSTGTGDITVTMNGPTQAVIGAYSFSGVNQTVPIPAHITRHNLTPSSPAISITTSHPNDWVLDLPSIWGGVTLGSPTCTQQWNVNVSGQITGASSSTIVPSPANVTCSWTASSDNMWDDAAIELRAAG